MANSLQMTLQRINAIERQFAALSMQTSLPTPENAKTDGDFQKILDKKIEAVKTNEPAPKEEIDRLIEEYSAKNNLDKDFVKSVVRHESGFNVNATSKCGAMGLMQLMPATAKGLGVTDPYNPVQNVEGGVKYLKSMLNKYNGNVILALAAYNAGPGAVDKYDGVPPYGETQNYVKSILANYL